MKLKRLLIIFAFSSLHFVAHAQSFEDGVRAYEERDYQTAFEIFSTLANQGHIDSANNLATLYQTGQGTAKNYSKAAEYYRLAAIAGHEDASFNLSTLYRLGVGVKRDLQQAYAWAIVAARNGESEMIASRDMIESILNNDDKVAAIALAKEYLAQLKEFELSIAWLVPQELKEQDIPKEYEKYFADNAYQKVEPDAAMAAFGDAVAETRASTPDYPTSTMSNDMLPPGFSVIKPKATASIGALANLETKALNLPAGFSIIKPKQADINPNNPEVSEDLSIPKGFHVLKPKEPSSNTDIADTDPSTNPSPSDPNNMTATAKRPVPKTIPAAPLKMSEGAILYRPGSIPKIDNATVIRPRRQIPAIVYPIHKIEIEEKTQTLLRSLANANYVSIEQLLSALITANPDAFSKQQPYRLLDPDTRLIVPSRGTIIKTPLLNN